MTGEEEYFDWIVYSGYLGMVKFGLEAKGVEGGNEIYQKVVSIWERQFRSAIESPQGTNCHPYRPNSLYVKLSFRHIGEGWFKVTVDHKRCVKYTKAPVIDAKVEFQRLASEAFMVNRSRRSERVWHNRNTSCVEPLPDSEQSKKQQSFPIGTINRFHVFKDQDFQ